jgi:ubiquitin carboxyl-terminal hydrolase 10
MCFANAVLQVMVYCPPFRRLFTQLGRILGGAGFASVTGKDRVVGGTPLVDATIQFLKEFSLRDVSKEGDEKGKEVDKPRAGEGEEENPRDAFIPYYIYDAMKEKKRFETMRVG